MPNMTYPKFFGAQNIWAVTERKLAQDIKSYNIKGPQEEQLLCWQGDPNKQTDKQRNSWTFCGMY